MSDDAKEWVTVKVPQSVRDDASDVSGTYGEILRAGITAIQERVVRVNHDGTVELRTDEPEAVSAKEFRERRESADLPDDLREQLDRIESAASTAEERTGQIQGTLDELGGR